MNLAGLRGNQSTECGGQSGVHSPIWELQKAVCGCGGAQVQALLGAVSHSNNRMQEARGAKGAMVGAAGGCCGLGRSGQWSSANVCSTPSDSHCQLGRQLSHCTLGLRGWRCVEILRKLGIWELGAQRS